MANGKLRSTHRTWEDWLGIALGIGVVLAPWVTGETANQPAVLNAAVAGFAVMMLAELDLVSFRRWTEVGLFIGGVWITTSPFIFGYMEIGTLRVWHLVAGLLVVLLSALELWQYSSEKQNR